MTPESFEKSQEGQKGRDLPLCSVLNTVVDFVMRDPTPLETREFDQKQSGGVLLQVPILRVFGPVVRRDTTRHLRVLPSPTQSACLHIHNAFPYILARPVQAGPDGSNLPATAGHVNWDSAADVERIVPVLLETLEAAIQASFQTFSGGKEAAKVTSTIEHARVVREITVTKGRGFYTYCPGPPAPFLRVEYYDPSLRWKVKRELERGLEGLPALYFPDPLQYDYPPQHNDPDAPLQFHCYEAHLPYTMQFFKDYNLSGMSYIHLHGAGTEGSLRFRGSMPKHNKQSTIEEHSLFLESNTADSYKWNESTNHETVSYEMPGAAAAPPWTKKETSCAVEMDVSVEAILNVDSVITQVEEADKDTVHWRAVPSLREIWQEERRRMSKLLPPKDDFLSQVLTLDVKSGAAKPGARLAVEGMKKLVGVTEGLLENFQRVMKQIIDRHSDSVDKVDSLLRSEHKALALTPSHEEAMSDLDVLQGLFVCETPAPSQSSTEAASEGPQHGAGRASRPPQSTSISVGITDSSRTPSVASPLENKALVSTPLSATNWESSQILSTPQSQSEERSQALSQSYYDLRRQSHTEACDETEFELSQRIERGEGIVVDGPFKELDDFIDPQTLLPYEDIGQEDEDDDMDGEYIDEGAIEKELSELATQTQIQNTERHSNHVRSTLTTPAEYTASTSRSSIRSRSIRFLDDSPISPDSDPGIVRKLLPESESASTPSMGETSRAEHTIDVDGISRITLVAKPPTQQEMSQKGREGALYAMQGDTAPPTWMSYLSQYVQVFGTQISTTPPPLARIQLVRPPPNQGAVVSWQRSNAKQKKHCQRNERSRRRTESARMAATGLPLDGNSRKLIVSAATTTSVEEADVKEGDWVEEGSVSSVDNGSQNQANHCQTPSSGECGAPIQTMPSETPQSGTPSEEALAGMGNQGGRLWVARGGELKTRTRPTQSRVTQNAGTTRNPVDQYLPSPVTLMIVEVHVQCRTGRAGVHDSKTIAMTPDSDRDKVAAVVYVYGRDPGGGDPLETLERGCIFVPVDKEIEAAMKGEATSRFLDPLAQAARRSIPKRVLGTTAPLSVECVRDERQLLLRMASIIRLKDPDMLLSWDTQGLGLGYLIERGFAMGKAGPTRKPTEDSVGKPPAPIELDLARLFSRIPTSSAQSTKSDNKGATLPEVPQVGLPVDKNVSNLGKGTKRNDRWKGSGLGVEWDDRVGAGAAAASVAGRVAFAVWKIVAEEVKHPNASYLPAVVSSVLNKRIPFHDNLKLSEWYGHRNGKERWRVMYHRLVQATCSLLLFDALDLIGRSGEAARLSGVEFSQSFPGIRGSQYKVEGVLLRALQSLNSNERGSKAGRRTPSKSLSALTSDSKSQSQSPWKKRRKQNCDSSQDTTEREASHNLNSRSYFFYSPSLQDTEKQEALEVQALTLEPQSGHHRDPIVVCDFTALYPSLVIAYNLCYSTCAGRLDYHTTRSEMRMQGRTRGRVGPFHYSEARSAAVFKHHVRSLSSDNRDRAYVAPTGTVYVSEEVLKGVLPQVLDEMLSTRAMLKKAAKLYKKHVKNLSPSILRQLEARQLALKYVANVTYGYTSATFSGRCAMPLLADTIVECARRTLTNAINLANGWGRDKESRWYGCEVLYGDTDSVFVKLPGRSVLEGFEFGEEFCAAVTKSNPPPVQLKLEKVYLGSILQTKKKYCGMKFESKDQKTPTFEAKGLETIRRDQCALTQKVLRNCLITLFQRDIQSVKEYLIRQWNLIIAGQLSVSDFILTGRVRSKYRGGRIGPVQAVLARRLSEADPGRIVRHKERVSYVIVATPGKSFRLKDCVLTPMELLEQWDAYTIHAGYYISRHLNAALQRCLSLAPHFLDVNAWYEACPKPRRRIHFWPITRSGGSIMISSYFGSDICYLCHSKCASQGTARTSICADCRRDGVHATEQILARLAEVQEKSHQVAKKCGDCNHCHETAFTFAQCTTGHNGTSHKGIITPLGNCSCIDCPMTYERHSLREVEIETAAAYSALGLF